MISKETFVHTITILQELDNKMNAVDVAMKNLNNDFCGFYMTEPFDMVINLLEESLNDSDGWISYFVWERNWLKDFKFGDVEVNGTPVHIDNWEDVYNFVLRMRD